MEARCRKWEASARGRFEPFIAGVEKRLSVERRLYYHMPKARLTKFSLALGGSKNSQERFL